MNPALPGRTYTAASILRSSAPSAGMLVNLLLGTEQEQAMDSDAVFIVTDQADEDGNTLLVNRENGEMVAAGPEAVWAMW